MLLPYNQTHMHVVLTEGHVKYNQNFVFVKKYKKKNIINKIEWQLVIYQQ